ncbi:MAG: ABC transporter permease [Sphaerochaeta sp.]|jgi:ribose/xylose/arabinose/galactoside ABC-type transport system permease subunit|nr:ABC transporter permease [Sphaerochaeta sp.]
MKRETNNNNNQKTTSKLRLRSIIPGDKLILVGAIIVVFVIFSSMNKNFFSWTNIVNILVAASLVGLIAIGHTYLIIAGQNDLSPGSLAALTGVVGALLVGHGIPFFVAFLITILVGAVVGIFNAWMINKIRIEAFIATLVTQAIVRGFAYIVCNGRPVAISNPTYIAIGQVRFLDIPLSVWIMLILELIFGLILARTRFGRSVYAIGGNKDAARLAGLNPQRIVTILFVMMGVITAIGGIVFSSRMHSGQPAANVNLEFDAITAVVLGGVSFTGGVGDMGGTLLGVLLIQAFNTGLIMVNVPSFWQYVARGALLLFALTSDYIRKTNREKALLEASKKALK